MNHRKRAIHSGEIIHSERHAAPRWSINFFIGSTLFLTFLIIIVARAPIQFLVVILAFEIVPLYIAITFPSKSSLFFQKGKAIVVREFLGSKPQVTEFREHQLANLYLTRHFRARETTDDLEIEFAVSCTDLQGNNHEILPALPYDSAVQILQQIAAHLGHESSDQAEPELRDPALAPILREFGILFGAVFCAAFLGLWLTS